MVAICIGAAGAVVAWSDVAFGTKTVRHHFVFGNGRNRLGLCSCSDMEHKELSPRASANRRANLEGDGEGFAMRSEDRIKRDAGQSDLAIGWPNGVGVVPQCFIFAAVLCPLLIWASWRTEPKRPLLAGAQLEGANLSSVRETYTK